MTMERPISFVPYEQWLKDNYPHPDTSADRQAHATSATARHRIAARLIAFGGWVSGAPPGNLPELQPPRTEQHLDT